MGYHLFIRGNHSLPMGDWEVALVRYFLLQGANRLGDHALAAAVGGWEYQGPGVWSGVDEGILLDCEQVFSASIESIIRSGEYLSVDYLNENVKLPGGIWTKEQPTSSLVATIRRLEQFLHRRT